MHVIVLLFCVFFINTCMYAGATSSLQSLKGRTGSRGRLLKDSVQQFVEKLGFCVTLEHLGAMTQKRHTEDAIVSMGHQKRVAIYANPLISTALAWVGTPGRYDTDFALNPAELHMFLLITFSI